MNVSQRRDTTTIRQTVTFKASPQDVYETLMDTAKHEALSGEKASISRAVGGAFTAWGDRFQSRAAAGTQDRAGLARQGLVARSLFDRNVRAAGAGWRHRTQLHPDRRPAAPLRRPFNRVDLGLLAADAGVVRERRAQRGLAIGQHGGATTDRQRRALNRAASPASKF